MSESAILVTGANGFVGQALCSDMLDRGIKFLPVMRTKSSTAHQAGIVKDIHPSTSWRAELENVDTVVHLAGRVHMVHDTSPNPLRDYRLTNVDATLNLAAQAAEIGVRRFIYLSSIKVNGESTTVQPFTEASLPSPVDAYGISKYEAEQALQKLSRETGLDVVIIRPPLVYGPGVKANFLQLMRWVSRGIPLPLASVDNRRSMIFVGNLVDFILRSIIHDGAAGRTFLVSDDHDVSIAELARNLSSAMGRRPMLFSLPPAVLRLAADLCGKGAVAERLLNSLQADVRYAKRMLEWAPPYPFETGIEKTVKHFLESNGSNYLETSC